MIKQSTSGPAPIECEIIEQGDALAVSWADGSTCRLDAKFLWTECPSAAGRRRRMDGRQHQASAKLQLVKADRIGRYAVNLGFSDGHDRGVYPWRLLAEFAARPTLSDFLIAATSSESSAEPQSHTARQGSKSSEIAKG